MKKFLSDIIKGFGKEGRIFTNEAQFQFALATKLRETLESDTYDILLEVLTHSEEKEIEGGQKRKKRNYTDIVAINKNTNKYIAIELKYKTAEYEREYEYGNKMLLSQAANDEGCYYFLKDVKRLELLKSGSKSEESHLNKCECIGGFAIILTNEKKYWELNFENCKSRYKSLCIGKETEIKAGSELKWESKKMSEKGEPIKLQNSYEKTDWSWEPYYNDEKKTNGEFQFLIVEVK